MKFIFVLIGFCFSAFALAGTMETQSHSENQERSLESRWKSAISNDRTDLLTKLLEEHINSGKSAEQLLRLDASNGKSALMVACKRGELQLVKKWVELGAKVNEVTSKTLILMPRVRMAGLQQL